MAPDSIYGVLHRECFELFPDEMFADLFTDVGRRSVPPMIVAVVMVMQRIEGLSDREAVERFALVYDTPCSIGEAQAANTGRRCQRRVKYWPSCGEASSRPSEGHFAPAVDSRLQSPLAHSGYERFSLRHIYGPELSCLSARPMIRPSSRTITSGATARMLRVSMSIVG